MGLKKMTPKEYKKYVVVEEGEVPIFEHLLKHGHHIMQGGSWWDDAWNWTKNAAQDTYDFVKPVVDVAAPIVDNPLAKAAIKGAIGLAPGGNIVNSGLSAIGYGEHIGDSYDGLRPHPMDDVAGDYKIGGGYKVGGAYLSLIHI